jgi:rhodanese-related sulfurtransferase
MEKLEVSNCIAQEELKRLIKNKKHQLKIIDVRTKTEYDKLHIPGSINIEISEIELINKLFDKNDLVITVCGKGGGRSMAAAEKLQEFGFIEAIWLCGGTFGWKSNHDKKNSLSQ